MINTKNIYAIILAGGSGTRLWPLSRELYPKHLLKFLNQDSLLKTTVQRLSGIISPSNTVFSTNTKLATDIKLQLRELNYEGYSLVTEPDVKNTAPAIALSTLYILKKLVHNGEDPLILVSPSDHIIKDENSFAESVKKGAELAQKGSIVTFGIKPQKLNTDYGYILAEGSQVTKFKEKPERNEAEEFIKQKNSYWNSGIFIFKASVFLEELKNYNKEMVEILTNSELLDEVPTVSYDCYNKMPEISIDHAIMENSKNLAFVPLDCGWQDIGSWEKLYQTVEKDTKNNFISGDVIDIDSENSFVCSTSKLISTIGLKDTIIVETEDAILACDRNRTNEVKQIFDLLKNRNDQAHEVHKTVYKPWGSYTVIQEGQGYKIKILQVDPGAKLSLQMHYRRSEHWVVLSGDSEITIEDKVHFLKPGQSIDIPIEAKHMLHNPGTSDLRIIEVQNGDYLGEDDIVRFTDLYGRTS